MTVTWRLLNYVSSDLKMNLAINEAVFRSRRMDLTPDTLHLWRGRKAVILADRASYKDDIDHEACRKYGVEIVRAMAVKPNVIYQDKGSLNFTLVLDASSLKGLVKDYQPVLSEYQIINEAIACGLKHFYANIKTDHEGNYINGKKISEELPTWFHNYLLFQGVIHVNTDLNIYKQIVKTYKKQITSLSHELGREVEMEEVEKVILQSVEETFAVKLKQQPPTEAEVKVAEKLRRIKYNSDKWIIYGHEPFLIGMGKTAVEVLVAYPPTSKCRKLIELVKDVVSDLKDEVEIRVWMRGKGFYQHGSHPEMSNALIQVGKRGEIPLIIVNGELKFRGSIPSREDLRKAILSAL